MMTNELPSANDKCGRGSNHPSGIGLMLVLLLFIHFLILFFILLLLRAPCEAARAGPRMRLKIRNVRKSGRKSRIAVAGI